MPDRRARRSTLARKHVHSSMYQEIAEKVKEFWDQGLSVLQIVAQVGASPPTIMNALAHWHKARGLPVPNIQQRQEALVDKMEALYKQGMPIKQIAQEVDMCCRSVTHLLKDRYQARGEDLPDGRTRRFRGNGSPGEGPEHPSAKPE